MAEKIRRQFVRPEGVAVLATILAGAIIITIGEVLLSMFEHGRPELERPELWAAVGFSLLILATGAFLATRPRGAGPIDRAVAIGHDSIFAPPLPPVDVQVRRGDVGTVDDLKEGDTLYARSGALAKVIGQIPGGEEHGVRYKGYIYAQGLYGASDELWIPVEAVVAVYPETGSAFLAIKGDETETFGWNRPPEHFRRTPRPPELPKAL